ncbi:hypothetical protein C900_05282 [Fulvivirga imtechensis AK7]|uniref:ATP-cone domain-containing protein n=2 Tax=Fulvivirga TaxID=396811 RepID=L8JJX7_9BACT|nr:hypothetical protein C900_05282 [Fulvivirga imtechensis AK7]
MSGEKDAFDVFKLKHSLEKSGAGDELVRKIIEEVKSSLYEGISTKKIYKQAFSLLRKNSRPAAARYALKKAIMELGPTGYPFENFIGEILKYQGFLVKVGVIVKGHCVNHEVDVIAEKGTKHFMVECKFHRDQGRHCDVKVPLYIHSRFKDIERQWKKHPDHESKIHQGWIFTNTRFTSDAIQYSSCMGLALVGWDYPRKGSLKERIDIAGLHPVTCLTTLTRHEKQLLLEKNIVLCRQLDSQSQLLSEIGVVKARHSAVIKEVEGLAIV